MCVVRSIWPYFGGGVGVVDKEGVDEVKKGLGEDQQIKVVVILFTKHK